MSWPEYLNKPILNIWGEREEGGREGGKKEKKTTEKKREETDKTRRWDRTGREGRSQLQRHCIPGRQVPWPC